MSTSISRLLPPFHLLIYGTLLGTSLYQTFVTTKVSFNALPMHAFTTLQKRAFPVYFRTQTILLIAVAVTYPPSSLVALANSWSDAVPLGVALGTAGMNLIVYGPAAQKAMVERIHQGKFDASLFPAVSYLCRLIDLDVPETKDGRKYNISEGQTEEMRLVNRRFSKSHAMSIHLNLIAVIGIVCYGFNLGLRLDVRG